MHPAKPAQSPALVAAMHRLRAFIADNGGSANIRQILANIFNNKTPDEKAINTCHQFVFDDDRFAITGEGAAAIVTLAMPKQGYDGNEVEPETLDPQAMAAGAAAEERQDEPAAEAPAVPEQVPAEAAQVPESPAAEDQTPPPADQAPTIDAQPTNEIVLKACAAAILSGMAANNGEAPEALDVIGYAKEEVAAAIGNLFLGGLVEKVNDSGAVLLVLTCAGWTEAMALAKKKADEELAKKNDELRALHRHVATEKGLAEEVRACEHEVEAAKQTVAACKESLAEANKKLAAFVRGDVQTSFLAEDRATEPTGEVTAYEKGMQAWDPAKAEAVNPFRDDPQRTDWQRGYDAAKAQNPKKEPAKEQPAGDAPKVDPAMKYAAARFGMTAEKLAGRTIEDGALVEIRAGKPINVKPNAVQAFERDYLVADHMNESATTSNPETFQCLPLYTKDEWASMGHEAKFGRCVEGIDQTDEARDQRQQGGEFCGKVVKLGRSKAVIGPVTEALWLVCEEETAPPAEDEPEDDDQDEEGN